MLRTDIASHKKKKESDLGNSFGPDEAFMVPGFGESWGTEAQRRTASSWGLTMKPMRRIRIAPATRGDCHSNALGSN